MPLGNLLIEHDLLDPNQLDEARQHQKTAGGSLVQSLLALELISSEKLDSSSGRSSSRLSRRSRASEERSSKASASSP